MKKLFTMLGAALMMGSFAANAGNPITVDYGYWEGDDYIYAQPLETEIVKNVDGSLTIKNFMNSGYPASFKFGDVEPDGYTTLTMCDNILAPTGYEPYLMKSSDYKLGEDGWPESDDEYMVCYYYNSEGGDATAIYYPYIWQKDISYTYVYRYDLEENPDHTEYYVCMALGGTFESGASSWGYVTFYFDMPNVEMPVSVMVCDADGNEVAQSFDTGLVKNDDGSFTMTDFFNSDYPVSFTFDVPANEGDTSAITFIGNVSVDGNYVDFLDSEGNDFSCVIYPEGSRKGTTLWYPGAYLGSNYCYVEKLDEEYAEYYGYDYMGAITMYCVPSGETSYTYYYLYFYFNLSETSGSTGDDSTDEPSTEEPIKYVPSTQNVTIAVNDYYYDKVADSYTADVSVSEDGSVTISDVLNSGQPMTFTFVRPDVKSWSSAIKVTSPTYYYYGTPYLLTPDGENYVNGKAYDYLGAEGATEIDTLAVGSSYVYRYDIENDGYDNEYFASIAMYGYIGDNYTDWFYLNFYFNMTEDTTGVEVVEDSDAPVEYYNLNGVKVANPSNGIFIRKQGNSVKKVVIK